MEIKGLTSKTKMISDLEDSALAMLGKLILISSAHYESSLRVHKMLTDFSGSSKAQSVLREVMF